MDIELSPVKIVRGECEPPPDKSISHRAIMFSAIAEGTSIVENFLRAEDTLSTMGAFRALGVRIDDRGRSVAITGKGLRGLREPFGVIDCGNSGTTMRLLTGLLSGLPFLSVLAGDESLSRRPMKRVINPMLAMGARIMARDGDRYPPIAVRGGGLKPIVYEMPVASAQVKSAVLLAALSVEDESTVIETVRSRDHTERMLPSYGADLSVEGLAVRIRGGRALHASDVTVPGDFSSAAFFVAAALIRDGSEVLLTNVGMNPTRTGFLAIVRRMGGSVDVVNARQVSGEPVADIVVRGSGLRGVTVGEDEVPACIDEFPILAVLAAFAEGRTEIRGARELRVKESDRVRAMADGLLRMGVEVVEFEDGLGIEGGGALRGAIIDSCGDHRIAMSFAVASLAVRGTTRILNAEAVSISYPGFFDTLRGLCV